MSTTPITCEVADLHLVELAYDESVSIDVRAHVEGCDRCGAELKGLRETRAVVGALPLEEPSPALDVKLAAALDEHFAPPQAEVIPLRKPSPMRWRAALSMAAALAVVASGTWLVESNKEPASSADRVAARAPESQAAVAAAPAPEAEKKALQDAAAVDMAPRAKEAAVPQAPVALGLAGGGVGASSLGGPSGGSADRLADSVRANLAPSRDEFEAKKSDAAPRPQLKAFASAPVEERAAPVAPAPPPPESAAAPAAPSPIAMRMAAPMAAAAPAARARALAEAADEEGGGASRPSAAKAKGQAASDASASDALQAGLERLHAGEPRQALDRFQAALQSPDATPIVRRDAMSGRVEAWLALGRLDEAEREARALVALFPDRAALLAKVLERRSPASAPASAPAPHP